MARARRGDEEPRKNDDERREDDGKHKPPPRQGNPDADPVKIHREYVERRVGGGAAPTSDAYESALEEWHKLPGAVTTPPTEVKVEKPQKPPEPDDSRRTQEGTEEEDRP